MLKFTRTKRYIVYLCLISALILVISGITVNTLTENGSATSSSNISETMVGGNSLFAQSLRSEMDNILTVMDYAKEAKKKGYRGADIPQKLFTTFRVVGKEGEVASIPVPLEGTTKEGVVFINSILPLGLPKGGSTIYIWKNGKKLPLRRGMEAEGEVTVQLPLDKGANYLCFIVKHNNRWWGRSRVLKIESPGAEIKKKEPPEIPFEDYWDEANDKKYNMMKKKSIIGFLEFTTTSRGRIVTNIPSPLRGSTDQGIVDSNIVLPNKLVGRNNSVYIWLNGSESLVRPRAGKRQRILSKIVLGNGANYVCGIVKRGNRYIGRTPMVRIDSSVTESIARFEMTWSGPGDMDLHLDAPSVGWHVGFHNRNVQQNGFNINLDVDNMSGYGPENIRVFQLPNKTNVRCFVNWYSGGGGLKVTIRHFDRDNKLVKTIHKRFPGHMRRPTSQFNSNSWVVGNFTIDP